MTKLWIHEYTGCPGTACWPWNLKSTQECLESESHGVFRSCPLTTSYFQLKLTKPRTLSAHAIQTVRDRTKMNRTNFVEHQILCKKVISHNFLSPVISSWEAIKNESWNCSSNVSKTSSVFGAALRTKWLKTENNSQKLYRTRFDALKKWSSQFLLYLQAFLHDVRWKSTIFQVS